MSPPCPHRVPFNGDYAPCTVSPSTLYRERGHGHGRITPPPRPERVPADPPLRPLRHHPLKSRSVNNTDRERLHWQRWLEMVEAEAKREIEAFCQPRLTDAKPLTPWPMKPLRP